MFLSIVDINRNTVYRSIHIPDHLNPFWDEFTLVLEELCYGDLEWPLKFTVFDYNANGKHHEIGDVETSVKELVSRVAIRGNADRELAFEISKEGKDKTRGLIVTLKADIRLTEDHSA